MGSTLGDGSSFQNYGVPLYGAAWFPTSPSDSTAEESESPLPSVVKRHVVLAGGGGEGRCGIRNALLVSTCDFESNSLSDQPVSNVETGSDLPYRIAVHPGGEGIICSFSKSCGWFELDSVTSSEKHTLCLKSSVKVFEQLKDVGQQLAMAFNNGGNLLAIGGQDGKLRVFMWPAMEPILSESDATTSVTDLDFSPDGKFLISVRSGSGNPCRVWNVSTSTSIASLRKEKDEVFCFCRFSQTTNSDQVLYVIAMQDKGGSIVKWKTATWKRISSAHVVRDPVSAFNVSPDGKLLAVGTVHGDILVISASSMRVQTVVREAHLGFVTALAFSQNSRVLISASMDSSSRVTLIKDKEKDGMNLWFILFVILLAVAYNFAGMNLWFILFVILLAVAFSWKELAVFPILHITGFSS